MALMRAADPYRHINDVGGPDAYPSSCSTVHRTGRRELVAQIALGRGDLR
jgi:hypothetical protein